MYPPEEKHLDSDGTPENVSSVCLGHGDAVKLATALDRTNVRC